ncbi:MAG: hypothetical protein CMK09_08440 [Ponticaulis sp.]|nr:hypothetical protein [Ponticaulis sp.]|tara:strand:- start:447 stop:656 length:210 start_codon:yes stop_codon:yes gene_type:complete
MHDISESRKRQLSEEDSIWRDYFKLTEPFVQRGALESFVWQYYSHPAGAAGEELLKKLQDEGESKGSES